MGEPAVPSQGERNRVLALAKSIVDAVRNDEELPTKYMRGTAIDGTFFRLAQDLVDTNAALQKACDTLELEGLEETAHRLRQLDLEVR